VLFLTDDDVACPVIVAINRAYSTRGQRQTQKSCPGMNQSSWLSGTLNGIEIAALASPIPHNFIMPLPVALSHDMTSVRRQMKGRKIVSIFAGVCFVILFGGCADFREELTAGAQRLPDFFPGAATSEGYWHGGNSPGPAKIVVHVSEQRAYFYKGRRLIGESTVSTGKRGFDTPPGRYRVIEKDKNHISSEFGDYVNHRGEVVKSNIDVRKDAQPAGTHIDGARMPYFMRFNGGYGMHAGYVPQFRASHGCIRLPARMARHFFENAPDDTPVIVKE
jgi:hypothetical protein